MGKYTMTEAARKQRSEAARNRLKTKTVALTTKQTRSRKTKAQIAKAEARLRAAITDAIGGNASALLEEDADDGTRLRLLFRAGLEELEGTPVELEQVLDNNGNVLGERKVLKPLAREVFKMADILGLTAEQQRTSPITSKDTGKEATEELFDLLKGMK